MKCLVFQRQKVGGKPYIYPVVKTKPRKFVEATAVEVIGRKTPTLITGLHDSGKSRMVERLYVEERAIWGRKIDAPAVYLAALRPLGAWSDNEHVAAWWETRAKALSEKAEAGEAVNPDKLRPWARLPAYAKSEALADYLTDTGAVLFIDDAHKLTGRKLQIARQCALAARIWVASATDENRIPPNLRAVLLLRDPQIIRLNSDVAYDATDILTWLVALLLLLAGAWQGSLAIAGFKALTHGARAARQDA
jgi:hypothetical protein